MPVLITGLFFAVLFPPVLPKTSAYAEDAGTATNLDQETAQYNDAMEKYNNAAAEASEIQSEIDNSSQELLDSQARLFENKSKLAAFIKDDYINNKVGLFLRAITNLDDINEVIKAIDYLDRIESYKTQLVANERQYVEEFQGKVDELHKRKDKQNQLVDSMSVHKNQAEAVLTDAKNRFQAEEDAKRLAELEQQNQGGQQGGDTPSPSPTPPGPGGDWTHGSASAYGPGESTATGELVTESSMGVSVVISRFPELKGRTIEIEYGGMSVFARVNDCGGLNGRDLDLQPGVSHAFGFGSPYAWGVRGVNYRYL